MGKVAISGGTGGVGQAIVDALDGRHGYIILTRSLSPSLDKQLKAKSVIVDYADVDGLVRILEQHDVHTVVSAVSLIPQGAGEAQLNLIRAAEKSNVTKRFIPSEFSLPTTEKVADSFPYHHHKAKAAQLLAQTSLEWALIHSGLFLDYWGMPYYPSRLAPVHFCVDMENNFTAIPGSGSVPAVFTHSSDIGRYIAAMLTLPAGGWPRECVVMGEKLSLNEFVMVAEETKGRRFEMVWDSVESLRSGETTELPIHRLTSQSKQYASDETMRRFISKLGLLIEAGNFDLDDRLSIAWRFPEIVPKKARDVLLVWKGK